MILKQSENKRLVCEIVQNANHYVVYNRLKFKNYNGCDIWEWVYASLSQYEAENFYNQMKDVQMIADFEQWFTSNN